MDIKIILLTVLLGFVGGLVWMVFTIFKNKKETEKDKERYIPTTQDHIPIDYIRSGIVRLKTGGYRIVLELPSINIDLMEPSEKEVIHNQYRSILTSFEFPFQYLQQSRTVDISEYLNTLEKIQKGANSNFVKNQLDFYSSYLVDLIKNSSVLTKKFYFVIPYDDTKELKEKKNYSNLSKEKKKKQKNEPVEEKNELYEEEQRFERARKVLFQRANVVARAFRRLDISPYVLNDHALLELYYTAYNKDRSVYQPLKGKNPNDFTTLRVQGDLKVNRGDKG